MNIEFGIDNKNTFEEDYRLYLITNNILKGTMKGVTDEQLAQLQKFILYFQNKYQSDEQEPTTAENLTKMIANRKSKRPSSTENKQINTVFKSGKMAIKRRSSSLDKMPKEKKKKEKKKRVMPHYKKFKPKRRDDVIYQGKRFKYKTQLVDGPQLACAYNATWHKAVSCKMYLNLGKKVYTKIIKNNDRIQELIDQGYIIVKNQHDEKEEDYIKQLKEKGKDPVNTIKKQVGPKPKPLEEDGEDDSEEEEAIVDKRKKNQVPKAMETDEEDEEDDEEVDFEKKLNQKASDKKKMAIEKTLEEDEQESEEEESEDESEDESSENDDEIPPVKKKSKKLNPVSTLKKPQKTTRDQLTEKISKHMKNSNKEEEQKLKENDSKKKKKTNTKNQKNKKKQTKKATKKGTKKGTKKAAKKPLKKPKMLEDEEGSSSEESEDIPEDEEEEDQE